MKEDELYRTSTQYRLWSFTPETLVSLRTSTNAIAAKRVRAAIKRAREEASSKANNDSNNNGTGREEKEKEIDCLTVEEEQKLVRFYCVKAMELADFCSFPTNVKATAVQYLRRFYLSNSPMTYNPKTIMPCALFLATKTENHHVPLSAFAAKVDKTTAEDVIAPEFLLTQGLRFTFDVRHPFRGLEGGFMELLLLADGKGVEVGLDQEAFNNANFTTTSRGDLKPRIQKAHTGAKDHLKTSAQLSDAYFLYTPSQIWLAALYAVDDTLAKAYLDSKFPSSSKSSTLKPKLLKTIATLSDLLVQQQQQSSASQQANKNEIQEMKRIGKKLFACQNPERLDLAGWNRAVKKGEKEKEEDDADDDDADTTSHNHNQKKKRRLDTTTTARDGQEKKEDDVFGGALPSSATGK